jgi:glycosyltransferase involved in cell wall biosynthesis
MRVLMVASGNDQPVYKVSPFVYEQTLALREKGIEVEIFPIIGKGVLGYLKAAFELNKLLKKKKFDIIHGHYLMAALVTILQFKVPVVTSFIGCDINVPKYRLLSKLTVFKRAKSVIFVSENLQRISGYNKKSHVVQYGLDLNKFYPVDKQEARKHLKWSENEIYVFFNSRFDRVEKNAQLAFAAIEILKKQGIQCKLIEFRNIKTEDLNFYYNASDLFLLTSIREGSPQSVKEALACNCPVVCTDVGDVKWVIGNTEGCYVTSFSIDDVTDKIIKAMEYSAKNGRTKGRERILELGLDVENIANKILEIYRKVLKENN